PNLLVWLEKRRATTKYRPWLVYLLVMAKDLSETDLQSIINRYPFDRHAMQCLRTVGSITEMANTINACPALAFSDLGKALNNQEPELIIYLLLSLNNEASFQRVIDYLGKRQELRPGVTGHDLKKWGLKAGPAFQQILDALGEARLDGLVTSRDDEEKIVKQWLAEGKYGLLTK
ncbi:MAG: poly(A) polymerase, partial [Methanomassiliicoccales archaeon]